MEIEKIITKCNIGKDSRVKFKNDEKLYYVKNISPDRIHVFVQDGVSTFMKKIMNIVKCNNMNLNETIKTVTKNLLNEFSIRYVKTTFKTYEDGKRLLGDKSMVNLHNRVIWLHRGYDNEVCVKYHSTDVLCFNELGNIRLYTGGWWTKSTKTVINSFLPNNTSIDSNKGYWIVVARNGTFPFKEKMVITADGEVLH